MHALRKSWAKPPSAAKCSRRFSPVLVDEGHNPVKAQENKAIGADVGGAGISGESWLLGPPPPLNTLR
jgi:hypothetical protein